MKTCTRCGVSKPLKDYAKNGSNLRTYCKPCHKDYALNHYQENKEMYRAGGKRYKLKKYGLTSESHLELLTSQKFKCPICSAPLSIEGKGTHIDHNHITGEVRGVLCQKCNQGIGLLMDNPAILRTAADYLEQRGYYG